MKSRFNPGRIFNEPTGWYVIMRESDAKIITSMKFKCFGSQYIMGPFKSKPEVTDWLEGYLAMHSDNRDTPYSPPEPISTHIH